MSEERTIICGVDDSEESSRALSVAAELSQRLDCRFVVVHVASDVSLPGVSAAPAGSERLAKAEEEQALALLEQRLANVELGDALARVAFGDPASGLAEVAAQERAGLIVVGSRGRGRVSSAVLGSVSADLTANSVCPVLVVPLEIQAPDLFSSSG